MFQISEFDAQEQSIVFCSSSQSAQSPSLNRSVVTEPDLRQCSVPPEAGVEPRARIGSDPPTTETEAQDELGYFRGRSKSAPPNLWAAMRYGRELRRMSDEFDLTVQGLPRPKSAGATGKLGKGNGWKDIFRNIWPQSRCKEEPSAPSKKF
ncbi:bcl2-associated agonist of cell death [Microcaecilia unicolor]|uniref:Bcl2-associated agonist of cell death n=1 Tax=Microcaecilia unicolor TaxID=1415580 RepID=A0A6P7ZF19_9AMPH|nr:bcl2-associated agonist of cell death [Microcaecilia unicolor]